MNTVNDAINHIADILNLTMEGAAWVYQFSNCPSWDEEGFKEYDFLNDKCMQLIPSRFVE